MELLSINFAILLFKICFCVLPGVLALAILFTSEETKLHWRNSFCHALLDVSDAIPYSKFRLTINVIGLLMLIYSLTVSWFFIVKG